MTSAKSIKSSSSAINLISPEIFNFIFSFFYLLFMFILLNKLINKLKLSFSNLKFSFI